MMGNITKNIKTLKQVSSAVSTNDLYESAKIIKKLEKELLESKNGIGLSAIQIGIPKRIFVIKNEVNGKIEFLHFINPSIISCDSEFIFCNEGCLSFPGLFLNVKRFHHYTIESGSWDGDEYARKQLYFYYPEDKNEHIKPENAVISIAVQHEMDHLEGKILPEFGIKSNQRVVRQKVGRNDPCPCGATKGGKPVKYKKCCGKK